MKVAFYAPMKSPRHPVPSGDRLIARLYWQALCKAGHDVQLVSELRSWAARSDDQSAIEADAIEEVERLRQLWTEQGPPEAWFTYHNYHKAPDHLGPKLSKEFNIPYVIAEPSHAPKQKNGHWQRGFTIAQQGIEHADLLLIQNPNDLACLNDLLGDDQRIKLIHPFIDTDAWQMPDISRSEIASQLSLNPALPWVVTVAMMRKGDKAESYDLLAQSMLPLMDIDWTLIVIGDGTARSTIEPKLRQLGEQRVHLLGECTDNTIRSVLAHSDVYFWPAVNEALGMSLLEAQAMGLPVVAGREGGVSRIVEHENTGLLVNDRDTAQFSRSVRRLISDASTRRVFGSAARKKTNELHSLSAAANIIDGFLATLVN